MRITLILILLIASGCSNLNEKNNQKISTSIDIEYNQKNMWKKESINTRLSIAPGQKIIIAGSKRDSTTIGKNYSEKNFSDVKFLIGLNKIEDTLKYEVIRLDKAKSTEENWVLFVSDLPNESSYINSGNANIKIIRH